MSEETIPVVDGVPVVPDGRKLTYIREDSGSMQAHNGLYLEPGGVYVVGEDLAGDLAARLVDNGHCALLPEDVVPVEDEPDATSDPEPVAQGAPAAPEAAQESTAIETGNTHPIEAAPADTHTEAEPAHADETAH